MKGYKMTILGEVKKILDKTLKAFSFKKEFVSPTYEYKRAEILRYAKEHDLKVFIETGTYKGETPAMLMNDFDELYTIELSEELYKMATERFARTKIKTHHGDSTKVLPEIIINIDKPILFWLDGHYSNAPFCAKGTLETPIIEELLTIFNAKDFPHVILIDDARCFGTEKDYPSIKELKKFICSHRPKADIAVYEDIIRIKL